MAIKNSKTNKTSTAATTSISMGTFGDIVFVAGMKKTVLPDGISMDVKGNWSTVSTPGNIEQSEFIAPQARTMKFDITFSAGLGVSPTVYLDKLRRIVENGEHHKLILNGKPVGKYEWYVESASETWNTVTRKGQIYSATVSLSLIQYR